jgi:hypothetical protein
MRVARNLIDGNHERRKTKMANDITIKDHDNDLALLGEAGHDLTAGDMVGVPLKFVKGVWQKKNTDQFTG